MDVDRAVEKFVVGSHMTEDEISCVSRILVEIRCSHLTTLEQRRAIRAHRTIIMGVEMLKYRNMSWAQMAMYNEIRKDSNNNADLVDAIAAIDILKWCGYNIHKYNSIIPMCTRQSPKPLADIITKIKQYIVTLASPQTIIDAANARLSRIGAIFVIVGDEVELRVIGGEQIEYKYGFIKHRKSYEYLLEGGKIYQVNSSDITDGMQIYNHYTESFMRSSSN
jgi:hypothetical protein